MKLTSNKPQVVEMIDQVIIRHITRQDLAALEWDGEYTHYRNLFRDAFERHQRGESILWVAEHPKTNLIGQVFVQLTGIRPELADGSQRAYIYAIRVRKPYQNLGIGTRLIQTAEEDLAWRGYRYISLNVNKDNLDAQRLYERLGYEIVAHEPGRWSYIDHRGRRRRVHEPAWRMVKKLPQRTGQTHR